MRKILKIAKLELSILIYSPVVWLVFPIFFVLCGMNFLESLMNMRVGLSLGGTNTMAITPQLYGGPVGLFTSIQNTLYLYMPILTMGIMSRETSSGSIKLLLSSPVRISGIILGKYLALVMVGFAFIFILALYGLIGFFAISHVDVGLIISGLLGLFLLTSTYAAIGLFMSSLTSYQIVAAIATLAVFSALRYVGSVWQSVDFIRDLTYFLSISGRTESMIFGLITTKDIFYYLIIISAFLGMSMLYLLNQRQLKTWKVKTARYTCLILAALLLGYATSRPVVTGYLDMTAGKVMSITENSQEIAKKIKGKLKITTYVNMIAPNMGFLMPEYRNNDLGRLEMYKRFIPGMEYEYVYFYHNMTDSAASMTSWNPNFKGMTDAKEIAEKTALLSGYDMKGFIGPKAIDSLIDLRDEGYFQVRKLEYNGKSTFLRFFVMGQDQYAYEPQWMAALQRLLGKTPKITVLTGNNEADITSVKDRGYKKLLSDKQRRTAMINQGFDVDTVNLETAEIPAETDILLLGDPTVAFNDSALAKIRAYIAAGGNMLVTTGPGRQAVVNPVLEQIGVQVKPGILVKPLKDLNKNQISAHYPASADSLDLNVPKLRQLEYPLVLDDAAALSITTTGGFECQQLVESPAGGWNRVAPIDPNQPALNFDAATGDEKGIFPVVAALQRKVNGKQQKIIVSGNANYMDNNSFNRDFMREIIQQANAEIPFRWLVGGKFPFAEIRPDAKDIDLNMSREQINVVAVLFKYLLPAIIVITGMIVLFRRRSN